MATKRSALPKPICNGGAGEFADSTAATSRVKRPLVSKMDGLLDSSAGFDPHNFLIKIEVGKSKLEYGKGDTVFSQGDSADAVFYIQNGKVKLTVVSKSGKEAVVAILAEGSFFGEGCLMGQPLRLATARAMTASEVMRIEIAEMLRVLRDEPAFGELFRTHLLVRNSHV